MFKRLFISFLLLSSLATEGIEDLPFWFLSLCVDRGFTIANAAYANTDNYNLRNGTSGSYIMAGSFFRCFLAEGNQTSKTKVQTIACNILVPGRELFNKADSLPGNIDTKKSMVDVLFKTDPSPPSA